ncbi:hypothetical protein EVAR_12405_1 [Eumeta japonica]|uniref:Uncharacterized protein n=1 Tax=Eumeta variegata TaxID=151549 RepID=A0A4C1TZY9_EUMVA|nr:hypothetical protein EVAR_12405_1 [Eumeta japonica]
MKTNANQREAVSYHISGQWHDCALFVVGLKIKVDGNNTRLVVYSVPPKDLKLLLSLASLFPYEHRHTEASPPPPERHNSDRTHTSRYNCRNKRILIRRGRSTRCHGDGPSRL